ncbi:MAG: hypothetical protein WDN26_01675 [Chitinophagaceae bacterium]
MNRPLFTFFLLLFACFICMGVQAQKPVAIFYPDSSKLPSPSTATMCSNDMVLQELRKNPAFKALEEKMNREILNALRTLDDIITLRLLFM